MPVLTSFFAMMHFAHKSYATKLEADSATRAAVTDFAAHSCEGGGNALASLVDAGLGILNQSVANAGSRAGDSGASQIMGGMVKSAAYSLTRQVVTRFSSTPIVSSAKMSCNEKPFDGNIGTWFKYAMSAFKGLGGISSSFP